MPHVIPRTSRFFFSWHLFLAATLASALGLNGAFGTTVIPPTFDELVGGSDYVIRAVVKQVSSEKKPGSHGIKIVTHVVFDVLEWIAGSAQEPITLDFLGGRVGDEEMIVEGMPRFVAGDEDILFVRGNGHTISPVYAMMYGRYSVSTDQVNGKKHLIGADGLPLTDVRKIGGPRAGAAGGSPVALSDTPLEPGEFIREIKARTELSRSTHAK